MTSFVTSKEIEDGISRHFDHFIFILFQGITTDWTRCPEPNSLFSRTECWYVFYAMTV